MMQMQGTRGPQEDEGREMERNKKGVRVQEKRMTGRRKGTANRKQQMKGIRGDEGEERNGGRYKIYLECEEK